MRFAIRRTPGIAWSAGGGITFDIQSTLNEFRNWKFPCIHNMSIIFDITAASTGLSGFVPRTIGSYLGTAIQLNDAGGPRINLRASSLHHLAKMEYGLSYANMPAVAASVGSAPMRVYMPLPIKPHKCRRDRDTTIPVRDFLDGGQVFLTAGAATAQTTGLTVTAATYYLLIKVVDEGVAEAKSRFVLRDQAIAVQDFAGYPIGGFLRGALWYNGEVNESAATPWASAKYDSNTLGFIQQQDTDLRELYLRESVTFRKDSGSIATASAVASEDGVDTGQIVPLVWPNQRQKISDYPQMPTLHVRTGGTITTSDLPKLITSVLEERNPTLTARVFGRSDVGAQLGARGMVKTASGAKKPITDFPPDLANVLPVKLKGEDGK